MTKIIMHCPLGRLHELASRPDANLLLIRPCKGTLADYAVIKFSTRTALEAMNKKMGLRPVVFTEVEHPVWAHQRKKP